jgi:hypothetical protein
MADIAQDSPDELAFQHVVLCHLGFPRSKTDARVFERHSGNAQLLLEAAYLRQNGRMVAQPLPYGTIPRLVMIAAVTRATQQKTRTIELGQSMRESLRTLGMADTGAAHWRNVGHGVVHDLADGGLLRLCLQVRPARLGRDPEDALGAVLVGVFGVGALGRLGEKLRVAFLEGIGNVLEEDETEDDVLVFRRHPSSRAASR